MQVADCFCTYKPLETAFTCATTCGACYTSDGYMCRCVVTVELLTWEAHSETLLPHDADPHL